MTTEPPSPTGSNWNIDVSLLDGANDRHPRGVTWTAEEMADRLTDCRLYRAQDKPRAKAWSPGLYTPGTTRGLDNVIRVSAFVLDVDDGTSLDRVWGCFSGHTRVLYTTWSHETNKPKCRLVLPLARTVPGEDWPLVWGHFAGEARRRGVTQDRVCKDASRLYFLPGVPSEAALSRFEARVELGLPRLDVDLEALRRASLRQVRAAMDAKKYRLQQLARKLVGYAPKVDYADPAVREMVAATIEARIVGDGVEQRATRGWCPSCGRQSVWFYIRAHFGSARCDHVRTCGWQGSLDRLHGHFERAPQAAFAGGR